MHGSLLGTLYKYVEVEQPRHLTSSPLDCLRGRDTEWLAPSALTAEHRSLLALTSMDGYLQMRSHITPVPTPPVVQVGASALTALAVAILTTELTRGWQLLIAVVSLAGAIVLTLAHPYRRRLREYATQRNVSRVPRLGQVIPLFILWLVLMLAPLLAPASLWITVLLGLAVFGWTMLTFPHFDGSRALAYA